MKRLDLPSSEYLLHRSIHHFSRRMLIGYKGYELYSINLFCLIVLPLAVPSFEKIEHGNHICNPLQISITKSRTTTRSLVKLFQIPVVL